MEVILRGTDRDKFMWRVTGTSDGMYHLQKKGFRGRSWVSLGNGDNPRILIRGLNVVWG